MIVATLPDPTVLPPSRYLNSVFCGIFYAFYCGKQRKIVVFVWRIFICMISWHRFGTKTTILLNCFIYMVLAPCKKNINKKNVNSLFFTTLINKLEFVYLLFRFTSSISAISSANGRYSPPHHSKTCIPSSSSTDSVSVITVL